MQCLSFPVSPSLHSDSSTALSSSLILPHKSLTPGETASSILSIILRAPIVIRHVHVETVRRHARAAANSPGEREAQLTKGTWIRRGYAKTPAAPAAEPPAEWNIIANGIGGVQDAESHKPVRPGRAWFPAANMPQGLYRDVVQERNKYFLLYHASFIAQAALMVLQLLIGASVTSLGAMNLHSGIPITVLGAVNTVIAGLIALLHNGGLPDRFRFDMIQFEEIEDHIKELLDSAIVPANMTTDQVLAECFDRFREAKAVVAANLPVNYNSRSTKSDGDQTSSTPPPPAPPAPPPASPPAPAPPGLAKALVCGDEAHEAQQPVGNGKGRQQQN